MGSLYNMVITSPIYIVRSLFTNLSKLMYGAHKVEDNHMRKMIWILVNNADTAFSASVVKVHDRLNELKRATTDVLVVCETDLIMKIDTFSGLSIFYKNEQLVRPDVVWCRINSEVLQLDRHVTLLRHLELMGSRVINSIDGIMKCTNKVWHLQELAMAKIPIATTLTQSTTDNAYFSNVDNTLTYPIVMKTVRGNGGKGVFMVPTDEMRKELNGVLKVDFPYLSQEYISESHGRDLRVIVVDGKPVFSMIRHSGDGTMRANLSQGGYGEVVTGVPRNAEILACNIAKILKLDICGVDLLMSDQFGYVCCEVNNNPGFSRDLYNETDIAGSIAQSLLKYI
jgi:RimK family alpha-L-glutamate ligase